MKKNSSYFINNTSDYYIVVDEHPEKITKVMDIIIAPGESYDSPFDMVENIKTGEVRKVGNGGRLIASESYDEGEITYESTHDIIGTIGSKVLNVKSKTGRTLDQNIEGDYIPRSKPGLYTLDKRPNDINKVFTDPNLSTLRQAEIKAMNLTVIRNVANGFKNNITGKFASLPNSTRFTSSGSISIIDDKFSFSKITFDELGKAYFGFPEYLKGCTK